jgi:folate-dependent phosphoribosylglycinamide formyltransferase PurN
MENVVPFLTITTGQRPRAAIFLSGSGSNAERLLAGIREAGDSAPLEIAVLATDAPETSRARELANAFGLPLVEHDIRAFYRDRGLNRVSIATAEGRRVRQEWTDVLRARLAPFKLDFGILAGFVPLTNITGDFPCLNVHPGDLTYLKNGERYLVGLHTIPVERAILEGLPSLRSSVIIAQPYEGSGGNMDSGPILGISEPVDIDLGDHPLAELAACAAARSERRPPGGYGDLLEEVAEHHLERLKTDGDWVVFPPVVWDFAKGRFAADAHGRLCYQAGGKWQPVETVVYGPGRREIIFRDTAGE